MQVPTMRTSSDADCRLVQPAEYTLASRSCSATPTSRRWQCGCKPLPSQRQCSRVDERREYSSGQLLLTMRTLCTGSFKNARCFICFSTWILILVGYLQVAEAQITSTITPPTNYTSYATTGVESTDFPTETTTPKSNREIIIISCSVIGGVIFLALIVVAILVCKNRRGRRDSPPPPPVKKDPPPVAAVQPFAHHSGGRGAGHDQVDAERNWRTSDPRISGSDDGEDYLYPDLDAQPIVRPSPSHAVSSHGAAQHTEEVYENTAFHQAAVSEGPRRPPGQSTHMNPAFEQPSETIPEYPPPSPPWTSTIDERAPLPTPPVRVPTGAPSWSPATHATSMMPDRQPPPVPGKKNPISTIVEPDITRSPDFKNALASKLSPLVALKPPSPTKPDKKRTKKSPNTPARYVDDNEEVRAPVEIPQQAFTFQASSAHGGASASQADSGEMYEVMLPTEDERKQALTPREITRPRLPPTHQSGTRDYRGEMSPTGHVDYGGDYELVENAEEEEEDFDGDYEVVDPLATSPKPPQISIANRPQLAAPPEISGEEYEDMTPNARSKPVVTKNPRVMKKPAMKPKPKTAKKPASVTPSSTPAADFGQEYGNMSRGSSLPAPTPTLPQFPQSSSLSRLPEIQPDDDDAVEESVREVSNGQNIYENVTIQKQQSVSPANPSGYTKGPFKTRIK